MKEDRDYIQDLAAMRSMMERSSKFLSLSGLAGILAGIYALVGAFIAYRIYGLKPVHTEYSSLSSGNGSSGLREIIYLGLAILVMAIGTAIYFSYKKAGKRGEKLWNATARRLVSNMAVPLVAGGLLILIMLSKGRAEFAAPFSLLFYGLALYNASKFTYEEVRSLGLIQVALGLAGCWFTGYGFLFWAIGFGLVHIIYGIYMHYRYEQ